jgi:hypothetical protein
MQLIRDDGTQTQYTLLPLPELEVSEREPTV